MTSPDPASPRVVELTTADHQAAAFWKSVWGSFADRLPTDDLAYALAKHREASASVSVVPEGCDCAARFYGDDRNTHQLSCAAPTTTPAPAHTDGVTYQPDAQVIINGQPATRKGDGSWSTTLAPTTDGKGGGLVASAHTDGATEARKHGADSYGDLNFDCADCNSAEPEDCMKATYCQHRDGPRCPTAHTDGEGVVPCDCAARFYGDDRDAHQSCCAAYTPSHTDTVQPSEAGEVERLREALGLALAYLAESEPDDSRAFSNEFVAMASVEAGCANDECMSIIAAALAALTKEPRDER